MSYHQVYSVKNIKMIKTKMRNVYTSFWHLFTTGISKFVYFIIIDPSLKKNNNNNRDTHVFRRGDLDCILAG